MASLRKILSPELVRRCDALLESRQRTGERLKDERERNDALLRPDGTTDVSNREAQRGRWMHRSELVRRIQKLNPNVWYEQSLNYPEQGGLYIADARVQPFLKRMVAALPHGMVNEFAVTITVPDIVPALGHAGDWDTIRKVDQKEPGWRLVLLKLLLDGLITTTQVEDEFQITRGRESERWHRAVH